MKSLTKKNIQQFYPDAIWHGLPGDTENYAIFFIEDEWCHLKKETLSAKEFALLAALFEQPMRHQVSPAAQEWLAFLNGEGKAPKETVFRILQFTIQQETTGFSLTNWQTTLEESIRTSCGLIWFNATQGVLIEEKGALTLKENELGELFATLDADFFLTTTLYIGEFYSTSAMTPQIFENEQQLFTFSRSHSPHLRLHRFVHCALAYTIATLPEQQPILAQLARDWEIDEQFTAIIHALWHCQGNVSSAAKELYLHRNTLTYRLDRFEELSGFSLRNNNGLFFCLLLLEKNK